MNGIFSGWTVLDVTALVSVMAMWFCFAWLVERSHWAKLSLTSVVNAQRLEWMLRLTNREARISDASLLGNLMRSMSFFASATVIILGGVAAMLGSADRGYDALRSIPALSLISKELYEEKVLLLGLIFIYSFLQFTWGMRQFNYCCILVGAAPLTSDTQQEKMAFAKMAARVTELGARSFNHGLRGYYFALATLAWFIHPLAYIAAGAAVVLILWRREFHSKTRRAFRGQYGA
ncbi:MAG TPA: DUF599 family protein [Candidatus Sulfotelmatobacter sp.]|jgi:uncharacterized membrane protein|nr:DUF599 family protein [Candidatus Sulfotelmatobacter sp.]